MPSLTWMTETECIERSEMVNSKDEYIIQNTHAQVKILILVWHIKEYKYYYLDRVCTEFVHWMLRIPSLLASNGRTKRYCLALTVAQYVIYYLYSGFRLVELQGKALCCIVAIVCNTTRI